MCHLLWFFFFFKQKTAYEMLRSLVGSEMCIRDRDESFVKAHYRLAEAFVGNGDHEQARESICKGCAVAKRTRGRRDALRKQMEGLRDSLEKDQAETQAKE
eukprot:TRINITY_DN17882_c0_g1_i1.p1 TRINITY_DN17882_c0_g1~~TRINITY_DN17882_c0_g1_i1.p1  ORF type:complete len:101 (-),score=47.26 TRINITY_DN17882_c0_g1_i1:174-476(-)